MIDQIAASRRSSSRRRRDLLCPAVAALLAATGAAGQTYNPYLTGQSGQTTNGTVGGAPGTTSVGPDGLPITGSSAGQTQTTTTGVTGQNITGYQQFDATGSGSGGFGAAYIPGVLPPATSGQVQVYKPTDGQNPGPLYARPLSTPGEFQLFEKPPPAPNEFEKYVQDQVGQPLPRFGSALLLQQAAGFAVPPTTTVPPDYALNPGDELDIGLTGSVEANLRLVIDNEGKIFIPRIGDVNVAGIRYGDLAAAIQRRISTQFKQVTVSVRVSHLHGLTIYVTGYATTPGAYTVNSLSTMIDAVLTAGGPSAGGSYRVIELRRNGRLISTLDLYKLLLDGDKSHDAILQNGDVLNVAPVGAELAVLGSVNEAAIFEAKPGESLADMIGYAGGFDSLADTSRIVLRSLADLDTGGSRQVASSALSTLPAQRGDIVRVLSLARVARPQERESVLANIEGEVDRPGRYYLAPGAHLSDLLAKAGGLTPGAFSYGTVVERESIRIEEQASFDKAIQNLQFAAAALPLQASTLSGGAAAATARSQGALQIIERLKSQRPDGRLILDVAPDASSPPVQLGLENNDRIFIPPQPRTIGVFGAVYKTGSFLYVPGERIDDYLKLAGGPEKIADRGDVFVVRANGSVISAREHHDLRRQSALPGDVIFVPVRSTVSVLDKVLAATSVVYQFGITALTLTALGL